MRKARGARLALPSVAALAALLVPLCAWADAARDGVVNPGNAEHIGIVEVKQEPAPAEDMDGAGAEPTESDAASSEPANDDEHAGDWTCPACGGCRDCCACPRRCGTLEFFGPLAMVNTHPPDEIFLSPVPERAAVLQPGQRSFDFRTDLTNVILRERDNGVVTDYDYEELRLTAEFRLGVGSGELSARLPLYYRSHGFLDGLMASWHELFGLPNGLRDDYPDNAYRYTIITREGPVYNGTSDSIGLGDLALGYKHALWGGAESRDALSLRAGAKLPLGDSSKAYGSGNFDFNLGALYERQITPHLRSYVNADYVFIGAPDWDNVGHQSGPVTLWGAEYAYNRATTYVAQYRTHRNFLRVGSREADKDAQELTLGFHTRLSERLVWSGGFNEDLNPETAPDFTAMSYLKWSF